MSKARNEVFLLSLLLPLAFSACTVRVSSNPTHADGEAAGQTAALDGFWVSDYEELHPELPQNPEVIQIQAGKILVGVKFQDTAPEFRPAGVLSKAAGEPHAFRVGRAGSGPGLFFELRPDGSLAKEFRYPGDGRSVVYHRLEESPAKQAIEAVGAKKKQDDGFANKWCEDRNALTGPDRDTVEAILAQARKMVAAAGTSTTGLIQARQRATGRPRTECQIIEDFLERGLAYAAGIAQALPDPQALELVDPLHPVISLAPLADLELTALKLDVSALSSLDLISGMRQLRELSLMRALSTDLVGKPVPGGLSALASLQNLKGLELIGLGWVDMGPLSAFKDLRSLSVRDPSVILKNSETVGQLKQLRQITFAAASAEGLSATLDGLPGLWNLDLDVQDGLEKLPAAALARLLSLGTDANTSEQFQLISKATRLKVLSLHSPLSDLSVMGPLSAVPGLTRIIARLRGEGAINLLPLGTLGSLQALSLQSASDTGSSVSLGDLMVLAGFARLTELEVKGIRLTSLAGILKILARGSASVHLEDCKLPESEQGSFHDSATRFSGRFRQEGLKWEPASHS